MLPYTIESSATTEGYRAEDNYKTNPYSLVIGKIIDMSNNDNPLNRDLIEDIATVIANHEASLVNDFGICQDKSNGVWIYRIKNKVLCRAFSKSSIRKAKIDYLKKLI